MWAGRRRGCVEAPNTSACVPLLTPSAAARATVREQPNVLFLLTDQQATWTVGAYHRQFTRLRADGRDSSAWAGRGFGPCVWRDGGCVNRAEDPCSS